MLPTLIITNMQSQSLEVQTGTFNNSEERILRIASQVSLNTIVEPKIRRSETETTLCVRTPDVKLFQHPISYVYVQKRTVEFVPSSLGLVLESFSPYVEYMVDDEVLYSEEIENEEIVNFPVSCKIVYCAPFIGRSFEYEDVYKRAVTVLFHREMEDIFVAEPRHLFVQNAVHRVEEELDSPVVHTSYIDVKVAPLPVVVSSTSLLLEIVSLYDCLIDAYTNRMGCSVYNHIHNLIDVAINQYNKITGLEFSISDLEFLRAICSTIDRPNNQGFLVDVELNPGPTVYIGTYLFLHLHISLWFQVLICKLLGFDIDFDSVYRCKFLHYYRCFMCVLVIVEHLANNQGFLVGVELNPGPNASFIIACLKNAENCELVCASRPKRTNSQAKRTARMQEKIKTRAKRARHEFVPEGMFEFGMDDGTKQFVDDSINALKQILQQGTEIKLDVVSPVIDKLTSLVRITKEKFGFIFDYFKFIFAVVYRHSVEVGKKLMAELGTLFFGFEVEGVIDNAFLLILYRDTIGKYIGNCDIIGVTKIISRMSDDRRNLKSTFSWVFELLKDITVAINTWFKTSIPVMSGDSKLDVYFKQFYDIKKKFDIQGASHYHIAQELYILHETVERYYRESQDRDDKEKVLYLLRLLKPLVQYCESSVNPNNGPRIEPLAVCITGPSGVGKSSFTTPVLLALLARVLPKDRLSEFMNNHNEFLFFRANENEYWDGYRSSHEAIVFDDFGQKKDIAGGDNPDAFEIIRLKNTAPILS